LNNAVKEKNFKTAFSRGCEKCDEGRIRIPKANGFGWTVRFCDCAYEYENAKMVYEIINQGGISKRCLLDNPISLITETQYKILDKLLSDDNDEKRNWLYVWGLPGTGKTFFATAAAQIALAKEMTVYSSMVSQFLDDMRPNSENVGVMDKAKDADVLILDDWGKEKSSDWVEERMFLILNYRYSENKITIITSNLDLDTGFDDNATTQAMIGRIKHASEIIEMSEKNYRTGKKYLK
jgi:DNA replication protein DnaC